ncbi:MAG: coenzyme F420-0:L-glutamate ligase [Patescibacteria group bacterium]
MEIKTIKTKIFKLSENLEDFMEHYLSSLKEGSILVVTSKIVALAEGRVADGTNPLIKKKIIEAESDFVLPTKHVYLTIKDGMVMANAGVDESNADGKIILLPRDSFKVAARLREYFRTKNKLNNLGVIITDSRCLPLRAGITGVALGYAGFRGLKDYRGERDIFKRPFKFSRVNVVDSLAAAAVVCMGEGNERLPLAIIAQAPVVFSNKVDKRELKINIQDDMYGPIFKFSGRTKGWRG